MTAGSGPAAPPLVRPATSPADTDNAPPADAAGDPAALAEAVAAEALAAGTMDAGPFATETSAAETFAAETIVIETITAVAIATDAIATGTIDTQTISGGTAERSAPGTSREPDEAALRLAEAFIFASIAPVTPRALAGLLPDDIDAAAVIPLLRQRYKARGIELVEFGGGLQFRTAPDLAAALRKVIRVPRRLPRVALETLAIVAYHQPVTRPEIEDLRGAALSQQTLDLLLENGLIVSRGRKETPGRPTMWGTTQAFLSYFGLRDIRELPRRQDLLLETVQTAPRGDPVGEAGEQPAGAPPAQTGRGEGTAAADDSPGGGTTAEAAPPDSEPA